MLTTIIHPSSLRPASLVQSLHDSRRIQATASNSMRYLHYFALTRCGDLARQFGHRLKVARRDTILLDDRVPILIARRKQLYQLILDGLDFGIL
jgi:hypothetical protein